MYRITVSLRGASHPIVLTTSPLPRFWKSWAMQQCPYGTVFTGASFTIARVPA